MVIDKHETLFLDGIKEDIRLLESGSITDANQQNNMIEGIIEKLSLIKDEQIYENIKKYREHKQEILSKKQEIEQQIQDIIDNKPEEKLKRQWKELDQQQFNNLKKMYKEVILKL